MNSLCVSIALSLLLLSLSGVHSYCESLKHLPEGEWICNSSIIINAVDSVGNCDVDLSQFVSGCVLLQVCGAHQLNLHTSTYISCTDIGHTSYPHSHSVNICLLTFSTI